METVTLMRLARHHAETFAPSLRHALEKLGETDPGLAGFILEDGVGRLMGHTEWLELFQSLRDVSYDGWCTIETFAWYKPEIARSTNCWRDIAGSADELGHDGIAFLRRTAATVATRGDGQSQVGALSVKPEPATTPLWEKRS